MLENMVVCHWKLAVADPGARTLCPLLLQRMPLLIGMYRTDPIPIKWYGYSYVCML